MLEAQEGANMYSGSWTNDTWFDQATEELVEKYQASSETLDAVLSICGSSENTYRELLQYYSNGEESFDFELKEVSKPSFDDFEDEWRMSNMA